SWYYDNTDLGAVQKRFTPVIQSRLSLCGVPVSSIGSRYAFVKSPHLSYSDFTEINRNAGFNSDSVYQAAYFVVFTGSQQKRQFLARGFPDSLIVEGQYVPSGAMPGNISSFFATLISSGALVRNKNSSNDLIPVGGVTGNGVLTTLADLPADQADSVK